MAGFDSADDKILREILNDSRVIAVVGLSDKPDRDSFRVAAYLKEQGYRIIPVNPKADEILGEKSYPDLKSIPEPVDVVDVFRRPEFATAIADEAIGIGAKTLWLQLGISNDEAAKKAEDAGLKVVQDACLKVEHSRLVGA